MKIKLFLRRFVLNAAIILLCLLLVLNWNAFRAWVSGSEDPRWMREEWIWHPNLLVISFCAAFILAWTKNR